MTRITIASASASLGLFAGVYTGVTVIHATKIRAGAALAVFAGCLSLAQARPLTSQIPTFESDARMVLLSASAVSKSGRPVTDLTVNDVQVFDEGAPQKVVHFSSGREGGARILLLVDASGSMNADLKLSSTKMAMLQILSSLDPVDEVALAGFDSKYWGVVAFTRDRKKIESSWTELQPFGTTALHDALNKGAEDLASWGEGRRAVIVITDGIDTASKKTPDEVIARSRSLDVPIYTLSVVSPLDNPESERFVGKDRALAAQGAQVLGRYADMSGGAAFIVSEFKDLKLAADQIVGELKHQYRIGYDLPDTGSKGFRRVEVRSTRKGVTVRTRSGYVPPAS